MAQIRAILLSSRVKPILLELKINRSRLFAFLIVLLYLFLAFSSAATDDVTYDESDHLNYGIALLKGSSVRDAPGRDFNTTMPVTTLNALPRAVQQVFHPGLHKHDWGISDIYSGRTISILAYLLMLLYGYLFARDMGGERAGLLAMLLLATSPNLLAHSRLVTTDVYAATAFVATLYHLYAWRVRKKRNHFLYWSIAIAVSMCCKINNILLYPISLITLLAYRQEAESRKALVKQILTGSLLFAAVQVIVINSCFLWQSVGLSLSEIPLKSRFFQDLSHGLAGHIPLPLSRPFIRTFDLAQYERESFQGTALNYLLGELRYKRGFWNYYLVVWLLKTPLFSQALMLLTAAACLLRKEWRKKALFFWWLPGLLLGILLSTSSVQSGYRYLLPLTALGLLFSAAVLASILDSRQRSRWYLAFPLFASLAIWDGYPNFIAYTNSLVTNKTMAYRWFADSNLDWGQRDQQVQLYLEQHPACKLEPSKPDTGRILVGVNKFTGTVEADRFRWLRENFRPVGNFGSCYLIFQVDSLPGHP